MPVGATRLPGLEQAASCMPFDQFGRYHMLREAVDACRQLLGVQRLRVLDVGGFYNDHGTPTLPLLNVLPDDDLTVLDVVDCDLPDYVKGDGTALQFGNASFDLVVSADTFEHIPQPQRPLFWRELLRVARHGVILLAPFSTPAVDAAERLLFEYIKVELHAEHGPLKEHLEYGLPELTQWLAFLEREQVPARAFPTGYVHAWLGMMLIKHMLMRIDPGLTTQYLVDSYYNRCFFPTERRNPAYRQLIIAQKTPGVVDAVDAALAPTLMPDLEDDSAAWGNALTPTLMTVLQRQLGAFAEQQAQRAQPHPDQERVHALERTLADQLLVNTQLNQQLAQHEAALRDVTERAAWLEQQATTLQQHLDAVRRGRVMRLLNTLPRRRRSKRH